MSVASIGGGRVGAGVYDAEIEDQGGEALAPELEALAGLDTLDEAEAAGDARGSAEALARLAGVSRTVDDALAAPSAEHLARALDPGRIGEALARLVRRGARPGESAQEQRMRQLVARLLDLRHEASAGMGKVSVG